MQTGFDDDKVNLCYYCGTLATVVDHVVPRHLLLRAGAAGIDLSRVMRMRLWEVNACAECNTLIGGAVFRTIRERTQFVKDRIRKRHRRVLSMPNWTADELSELGPRMRQHVEAGLSKKEFVKQRLAWRPAEFAEDVSAVMDLFKNIVARDVNKSPTGDDA